MPHRYVLLGIDHPCGRLYPMVLKSKKSKSKRTTLRHKYKVIKKVKQHLKKKAKEERKSKASGKKPKAVKDPGIPAQWPFKEELLKDLEWQKQRILEQEKTRKANNKLKRVWVICLSADLLGNINAFNLGCNKVVA